MSRYHVATTAVAAAPIDVVWARVADITTWSQWDEWDETIRVRDGEPTPDGVGALRRYRRGRRVHTEEVVAFEAPHRLAYEVREGLPVRDYHAELGLEPVGGGTRIRWVSDFDGANPISGWAVHQVLKRFFPATARTLARAPEADASTS
ncbi:MAG TPA: SRPBCC family protein [Acidimicrobiia bacterium]